MRLLFSSGVTDVIVLVRRKALEAAAEEFAQLMSGRERCRLNWLSLANIDTWTGLQEDRFM